MDKPAHGHTDFGKVNDQKPHGVWDRRGGVVRIYGGAQAQESEQEKGQASSY